MVSTQLYAEMTFRLVVALLLCGAIGLQRAFAGKAAGVRTHILVGLGAAVMTLVSAYAFPSWPGGPHDPTRIAAQIVSGIGFIGGGMILKEGITVRGLTTAASLWAVAGVGMAAGSGLVPLALIATALMLGTLSLLGRVDHLIPQQRRTVWTLSFSMTDTEKLMDLHALLHAGCPIVHLVAFETAGAGRAARFTFEIAAPHRFDVVRASADLVAHGALDPQWKADSYGEELG